jgi:guanine deaminase
MAMPAMPGGRPTPTLPPAPPFSVRARVLTPLADGGIRYEPDARLVVGPDGAIARVERWGASTPADAVVDLRPMVVLPGLVDLHVHLPLVPAAGLGAGMDLLAWLERHVFARERAFRAPVAEAQMPAILEAMAAAGTTTILAYAAVWADSTDVAFRAAEAHGIRATIGAVMMDRLAFDDETPAPQRLDRALREGAELADRWDGAADGRLRYAFTPRFAVSCTADLLRESAALARERDAIWQTHVSEDAREIETVARLFPDARDYLDVYDRAGGLGPRSVLAHAIHLSDRELARLVESETRVAHCPASNLFIESGVMPLGRYLDAGAVIGLGSDAAGGPELSVFAQMRVGFYAANARRVATGDLRPAPDPLEMLRIATLGGARALGMDDRIGSLEAGKEADMILVDPRPTLPPAGEDSDDPAELMSRLVFRERAGMVRGAWVRGRLLEGPEA